MACMHFWLDHYISAAFMQVSSVFKMGSLPGHYLQASHELSADLHKWLVGDQKMQQCVSEHFQLIFHTRWPDMCIYVAHLHMSMGHNAGLPTGLRPCCSPGIGSTHTAALVVSFMY